VITNTTLEGVPTVQIYVGVLHDLSGFIYTWRQLLVMNFMPK